MNETMQLILALIAGLLLGAIFFGGLCLTVLNGVSASQPALWFGLSFLLRTGTVLAGFYFIAGADWKRLLVCLSGFIIARIIVTRLSSTRMSGMHVARKQMTREANHAP
jgi:F1F0 ATPase subunit 2